MQSKARSVTEYLRELPADRRAALEAVRRTIRASVTRDVEETMQYGMIGYVIPHRVFPDGYHCDPSQPVPYVALASQKQHMAVYLMFAYGNDEERFIREAYAKAGKRLDLGKSCLRFKRLEDLDLEILAAAIRRTPARDYLARYVATVGERAWRKAAPAKAAPPGKQATSARRAAPAKTATPAQKPRVTKQSPSARKSAARGGAPAARRRRA